jgi:predicted esterase
MKTVLLVLLCGSVFAQTPKQGTAAGFKYLEIIQGEETGALPLLIAFHYSGGTPAETRQDYTLLKHPVRIILPQGNFPKRQGFSYFPTDYYQKDSLTQYTLARKTVDSLALFVHALTTKYQQKAVVSGISQGGDLSLLLPLHYPEQISAAFAFAAVISPFIVAERPVKVPFYLYQGEADPIVPLATTLRRIKQLSPALSLTLFTYPELGHDISEAMKKEYSAAIDRYLLKR